jgi:hypothetical protein
MRLPSGGTSAIAVVVTGALLAATAGGGGLLEGRIAFDLQARAATVHQSWAAMRADGIPDSELAILEQEWIYSQKVKFLGVGTLFWWPGASGIVDRWQSQSAAIYARDLVQYRAGAVAADQSLHAALGAEPWAQRKARLDALSIATKPDEFAALRSDWDLEARLVPIDRNIAAVAGAVATQVLQAKNLAIQSDPGPAVMTRANLIFIPAFGYLAASTTTVITEASLCLFGWWFVRRSHPELRLAAVRLSWRILLAGAVMGVVLYPLSRFSIAISLPAGGLTYVIAIYLIRAIEPEEWRLARDGLLARLRPARTA